MSETSLEADWLLIYDVMGQALENLGFATMNEYTAFEKFKLDEGRARRLIEYVINERDIFMDLCAYITETELRKKDRN